MKLHPSFCAGLLYVAIIASPTAQPLFSDDFRTAFTTTQAERGDRTYRRLCASCHGVALEGNQFGPPLRGPQFEQHWRGRSLQDLSSQIRATMPPGATHSVSSEEFADIEAFLLHANGLNAVVTAPQHAAAPSAPPPPRQTAPAAPIAQDDPRYDAALAARRDQLLALRTVTAAMLLAPPDSAWLMWRRTYDGHGYSPLRQIDRTNAHRLRTAWSWPLPESMNEITPLIHDGVMFIYSGPVVQALDAASGDLLWQYRRTLPDAYDQGRRSRVKTLAIYGDQLFVPMADGHLIALDMRTGAVIWDREIVNDPAPNALQMNGGPIVVRGKVIIGVSLGVDSGGGCFIVALDAHTGEEHWRFHTVARPNDPAEDSWNGAPLHERFGGGVWTAGTYDAELDLIYFGAGNTYNSATLLEPRPGQTQLSANHALYTNATLALRPADGSLAWYFQHHRRDVWDLDWTFERTVLTLEVDGQLRKAVVTGGKTAIFEALDAATGEFIFARDLGVQNLITAIDAHTGAKTENPALQPTAGVAKRLCPSNFGARNWPATAVVPQLGALFVPMLINVCADYFYEPRTPEQTARGGIDMRFVPRLAAGSNGEFGQLLALDLSTRRLLWTHRQRIPLAGSLLATAGGLIFSGDIDRYFSAYDQATGKMLWRTRLSGAPESSPVTYAVNGKQYVAVVAGGTTPYGANARAFVPEVAGGGAGLTVVVFELAEHD